MLEYLDGKDVKRDDIPDCPDNSQAYQYAGNRRDGGLRFASAIYIFIDCKTGEKRGSGSICGVTTAWRPVSLWRFHAERLRLQRLGLLLLLAGGYRFAAHHRRALVKHATRLQRRGPGWRYPVLSDRWKNVARGNVYRQ